MQRVIITIPFATETVSPTHGQEDQDIPIGVTATILTAVFVIAVVVSLSIGRRRLYILCLI